MPAAILSVLMSWLAPLAGAQQGGAEVIYYSRCVGVQKHASAAELSRSYYQLEAVRVEKHRPAAGATPQLVFSFKLNRRGVSDCGDILNPMLHPSKPLLLFTSDHDQERSLFKSNAFWAGTDGKDYLQLSPYRSDGRWQPAEEGKGGRVVGRVQSPVGAESGAIVFLEGVAEGARTDAGGNFAFDNVPAGQDRHLVAWKMALHDPQAVLHHVQDLNFGASAVTIVPGAVVQAAVPLAYRGFGYAGEENTRGYLEYAAWGPDGSVYAVFGEKVVCQVHPAFKPVRNMGVFTRGIAYHPGRKQWAIITAEGVAITDAAFTPLGVVLTNKQLQGWLNNAWSSVGSTGLNNSCICWSPGGNQVMFEIAGGRGILVYDFAANRLHLAAWSQDAWATFRVGSFSPDGDFIVCTVEAASPAGPATQLHAVRWAQPQESYPILNAPGIQRSCWGRAIE